jgi:hypothetical protein
VTLVGPIAYFTRILAVRPAYTKLDFVDHSFPILSAEQLMLAKYFEGMALKGASIPVRAILATGIVAPLIVQRFPK